MARGLLKINNSILQTGFIHNKNNLEPEKVLEMILNPNENKTVIIDTMPQPGSFYPVNIVIQSKDIHYGLLVKK